MKPLLPQDDPLLLARRKERERACETYRYDRSVSDCLFAEEVPLRDKGGARYWAELVEANLAVAVNKAAAIQPKEALESATEKLRDLATRLTPERFRREPSHLSDAAGEHDDGHPVASEEDLARAYVTLPKPPVLDRWDDDALFAWLAIAGCNPTLLTRLHEAPRCLTQDRFARAVPGGDLAATLAAGRLFAVDFSRFADATGGTVDGLQKYIDATLALYTWTGDDFVVVGIRTGAEEDALFAQPGQGVTWKMAKLAHLATDSQVSGLVGHFGLCHLVMEAVVLATKRCLADRHPLRPLLDAHTENTLIVNDITRSSLTPVDGTIDRMMAMTREASLALTASEVRAVRIMESAPRDDMAQRGVLDPEVLPLFPYRDDQLPIWDALEAWIHAYVGAYYESDDDVLGDEELLAFVTELQDHDQGGLAGIGEVQTVDKLSALLTRLVFRGTVYHAAINYSLYDTGYAALQPQASFGPGPTGNDDDEAWRMQLPPYAIAYEVIEAFYPLTVRINTLGQYEHLKDPKIQEPLKEFQARLAQIEEDTKARDAGRYLSYPYLLPSRVSNSIHV